MRGSLIAAVSLLVPVLVAQPPRKASSGARSTEQGDAHAMQRPREMRLARNMFIGLFLAQTPLQYRDPYHCDIKIMFKDKRERIKKVKPLLKAKD